MQEKLFISNEKIIENKILERAKEILSNVGLTETGLQNKKILDIGAGNAELAKIFNGKNNTVIFSLEKNLKELKEREGFDEKNSNYIFADAEKTPFKDEEFELLISSGGPPLICETKDEMLKVIKEGFRILKKGGIWRIGKGYLSAAAFPEADTLPDDMATEILMQKIRDFGNKFLHEIWPGKITEVNIGENPDDMYYILEKEK